MNLLLLAQQAVDNPAFAALRDSMRKEGEYARINHMGSFWTVVGIATVLALVISAVARLRPLQSRALAVPPRRLFLQAAKSLGIGRLNRFLLFRAACASRLEHPTVMLITPHLFETHAGEWADHFPIASLRRFLRNRVNQVKAGVFEVSAVSS